nr:hypothetical protein BdHM001_35280 [Bdellovibrio sp. HM001]
MTTVSSVDVFKEIRRKTKVYNARLLRVKKAYTKLRDTDPTVVNERTGEVDAEETMFAFASLKKAGFKLMEASFMAVADASQDAKYFESEIRLGKADRIIENKGFTKITSDLRESVILSNPELKDLKVAIEKLKAFSRIVDKYCDSLMADEVNYRKAAEKRLSGF